MVARQSLPEVYTLNGAFYLTHREILRDQRTFLPKKTLPYVMPHERSMNLDNQWDLVVLDLLLEKGIVTAEEYD
jgi:CMP-N-acetylneuraminic acid synthetase